MLKALSTKHLYVVIKTRWKGLRNLNVYFIIADQSFFSFFSNLDPYQLQTTDTIAPWRDSIFWSLLKEKRTWKLVLGFSRRNNAVHTLLFLFLLNGKLGCVLNKQRFLSYIAGTPLIPKPIIVKGINLKCLSKKPGHLDVNKTEMWDKVQF